MTALCEICWAVPGKYKCPACERRTCSVECVKKHKEQYECTGKRPRTEPAAPVNAFTSHIIMRDFGFLEEVDFAIDRAGRDIQHQSQELQLYQRKASQRRQALLDACAWPSRRINLVFAPAALSLARSNTSKVVGLTDGKQKNRKHGKGGKAANGKGKDTKEAIPSIYWRVDWHFGKSDQVITDRGLLENEKLDVALHRFLDNTWQLKATRHLILPYAEAGIDQLEVFLHQPTPPTASSSSSDSLCREDGASADDTTAGSDVKREPFFRCTKTASLQDNLVGRTIVEFPVLHVALPEECSKFLRPGDR